jgi:hypothetical protein
MMTSLPQASILWGYAEWWQVGALVVVIGLIVFLIQYRKRQM